MRALSVAALAALIFCHGPVRAQTAGEDAARIHTLVAAEGFPGAGEMRGAGAAGPADTWLKSADIPEEILAAVRGRTAGPRHQIVIAQVGLAVMVETDDRVTDCRGTFGRAELAPRLCALIRARGQFRHALAADGTPVRSEASVTVQYSLDGPGGNTGLPPAPAPMPDSQWPIRNYPYRAAISKEPDWRRFSRIRDGPTVAVALFFRNGAMVGCNVLRPSGNPHLDQGTCAAARTGSYTIEPARDYQRLPMLVRWDRDGAKPVLPTQKWQPAELANKADLVVRGVKGNPAAAWLDLSEAGSVTRCRVERSAGSDAADLAMCNLLRATSFMPARDVFGEPFAASYRAEVRFE